MKKSGGELKIQKILVPTDFTSHSDKAINYAVMMARAFEARILLIHVIEPFTYSVSETIQVMDHYVALREIADPIMDNLREQLSKQAKVDTFIVKGFPYVEIVKKAKQSKADLIVMGTHGRTGLKHLLMGSVAERVVRLARCPVLTIGK